MSGPATSPHLAAADAQTRSESDVRLARLAIVSDEDFVRLTLRHSRYLDNKSKENAREALRRFNRLMADKETGE